MIDCSHSARRLKKAPTALDNELRFFQTIISSGTLIRMTSISNQMLSNCSNGIWFRCSTRERWSPSLVRCRTENWWLLFIRTPVNASKRVIKSRTSRRIRLGDPMQIRTNQIFNCDSSVQFFGRQGLTTPRRTTRTTNQLISDPQTESRDLVYTYII